jgi:hypothetical protein
MERVKAGVLILGRVLVKHHGFKWFVSGKSCEIAVHHTRVDKPIRLNDIRRLYPSSVCDGDEGDLGDSIGAAYEELVYLTEWQIPPPAPETV